MWTAQGKFSGQWQSQRCTTLNMRKTFRFFLPLDETHLLSEYSQKKRLHNNLNQSNQLLQSCSLHWCLYALKSWSSSKLEMPQKGRGKEATIISLLVHISTTIAKERWQKNCSSSHPNLGIESETWRQISLVNLLAASLLPTQCHLLLQNSSYTLLTTPAICLVLFFKSSLWAELTRWRIRQVLMLTATKQKFTAETRSGNQVHPFGQQINIGLTQAFHITVFLLLFLHKTGWSISSTHREIKNYSTFGILLSLILLGPVCSLENTPDLGKHLPRPTQLIQPPSKKLTPKVGSFVLH